MIEPGNLLAITMMLIWPMVIFFIFSSKPIGEAIVWSLLCTALVLPVSTVIKLPLFPDFDKVTIAAVSTFICALIFAKGSDKFMPKSGWVRFFIILFIFAPVITVFNNSEPQIALESSRPGLGFIDLQNIIVKNFLSLAPFLLGYRYLGNEKSHETILRIFVIAGLIYSLPILYEIRMSPRLHSIFYGYFPHDWRQQQREGGFRSVVFLGHGLLVSIFLLTSVIASVSLWKKSKPIFSIPPVLVSFYLFIVLLINKSLGAVVFAFTAIMVMLVFSPRKQLQVAALLALLCITYPLLKWTHIFPNDLLVNTAALHSEDRARSLAFRFDQEEILLEQAAIKPLFGWGIWGRSRPMGEVSGQDTAVTDGSWLLILGEFGWAGYLATFGLLGAPIIMAYRKPIKGQTTLISTAGLSLIVVFVLLDQLPNASISPWLWMMSGALLGFAEQRKTIDVKAESVDVSKI